MAGKTETCWQRLFVRVKLQTLNKRVTKKSYKNVLLYNSQPVKKDKIHSEIRCKRQHDEANKAKTNTVIKVKS